jgi:hypothetical protein
MSAVPLDHRERAVGPYPCHHSRVRLELRARRTRPLRNLLSPREHNVLHDDDGQYSRERCGYHRTNLLGDTHSLPQLC